MVNFQVGIWVLTQEGKTSNNLAINNLNKIIINKIILKNNRPPRNNNKK